MQIQKINVEIVLVFNNLFTHTVFDGSAHQCISSYCTLYLRKKNTTAMIQVVYRNYITVLKDTIFQ